MLGESLLGQLAQHIAHMLNMPLADLQQQMRRLTRRTRAPAGQPAAAPAAAQPPAAVPGSQPPAAKVPAAEATSPAAVPPGIPANMACTPGATISPLKMQLSSEFAPSRLPPW